MDLGKAWLVLEESHHSQERRLLSVLSFRKGSGYVQNYIEQKYVDEFGGFIEKIEYNKNRAHSPFRMEKYEQTQTVLICGQDPVFRAYQCHKLKLQRNKLVFFYWHFKQIQGGVQRKERQGDLSVL